ncbi:hypothetical protein EZS27_021106 [termite gut metagenome]|jgi:hypothetical protein|uniref:Uncharacterized protein n=1 Tax=termite gut metagenome TaxID=433724 RepID=A0A5J4R9X9_9ZZZZ
MDVLQVANEIYSETGMLPDKIITDKKEEVRFEKKDYHLLRKGKINEETYIDNNLIM